MYITSFKLDAGYDLAHAQVKVMVQDSEFLNQEELNIFEMQNIFTMLLSSYCFEDVVERSVHQRNMAYRAR